MVRSRPISVGWSREIGSGWRINGALAARGGPGVEPTSNSPLRGGRTRGPAPRSKVLRSQVERKGHTRPPARLCGSGHSDTALRVLWTRQVGVSLRCHRLDDFTASVTSPAPDDRPLASSSRMRRCAQADGAGILCGELVLPLGDQGTRAPEDNAVLLTPPLTVEFTPRAKPPVPPLTLDACARALLSVPPATVAESPAVRSEIHPV